MNQILLIEKSATLRHAAKKLAHDAGYKVRDVASFAEGLKAFSEMKDQEAIQGVVLGWPAKTDESADELFTLVMEPDHHDLGVIVLSHVVESMERSWVTRRSNTALVLWDDYQEFVDALNTLVSKGSTVSVSELISEPKHEDIKVLFVDDSPTIRVTYRRLLKDHGYNVETASCVSEAIEKASEGNYDIVITDYYMPDGTGDTLCAKLRQDPVTAGITSAIITGTYSDKAIISSLAAGAVECMFKNEPQELFIARLNAMSRSILAMRNIKKDHEHLQGILTSVGEGVYGVNCEGTITFVNPAAKRILGYKDDKYFIGKSAQRLFHNGGAEGGLDPIEDCNLQNAYKSGKQLHAWSTNFNHANGKSISVECTVYPLYSDEKLEGSVVAFRDVTERRLLLEELRWQATHDPLTKLPNRTYFEQQLIQEVSRLKRSEESSALLYIDLDRFKYINDTAGHMVGDKLLVDVGQQFRSRLRAADMLARIGGDEFAVIMRNVAEQDTYLAADDFRNVLEDYQFVHAGKRYKVNASIGVAFITSNTRASGEVLANADIACYIAKSRGRNTTHFFHGDNEEISSMDIELGWSTRLHDALKNDKFELHYQPIISLADIDFDNLPSENGSLWHELLKSQNVNELRYEVLLRLPDGRGNKISPEVFLPTAERFNMMKDIDRWVIKHALANLAKHSESERSITLTINLSGQTLEDADLGSYITNLVKSYKVDASRVVFEITETSAIANLESANRFMNELRDLGCRFALDDFGSGFCSFSHLKYLSVDVIKIDGVFIQGMLNDPVDRAIVESIAQIARSVNKSTVAEFVENPGLLKLLREIGVDYIQGYYVSGPRDSADFPELTIGFDPAMLDTKPPPVSGDTQAVAGHSTAPSGEKLVKLCATPQKPATGSASTGFSPDPAPTGRVIPRATAEHSNESFDRDGNLAYDSMQWEVVDSDATLAHDVHERPKDDSYATTTEVQNSEPQWNSETSVEGSIEEDIGEDIVLAASPASDSFDETVTDAEDSDLFQDSIELADDGHPGGLSAADVDMEWDLVDTDSAIGVTGDPQYDDVVSASKANHVTLELESPNSVPDEVSEDTSFSLQDNQAYAVEDLAFDDTDTNMDRFGLTREDDGLHGGFPPQDTSSSRTTQRSATPEVSEVSKTTQKQPPPRAQLQTPPAANGQQVVDESSPFTTTRQSSGSQSNPFSVTEYVNEADFSRGADNLSVEAEIELHSPVLDSEEPGFEFSSFDSTTVEDDPPLTLELEDFVLDSEMDSSPLMLGPGDIVQKDNSPLSEMDDEITLSKIDSNK